MKQFFVVITDTFGGDANYGWVHRYLVSANTQRGAIGKVSHYSGYRFRASYESRYDARGAAVCAFVEEVDAESVSNIRQQYLATEI